jgi:hypothetical protein
MFPLPGLTSLQALLQQEMRHLIRDVLEILRQLATSRWEVYPSATAVHFGP